MRDVINKNVTEEELLDTVQRGVRAGWRRLKLYFMIGLPSETDEDVRGDRRARRDACSDVAREATSRGAARFGARVRLRLDVRAQGAHAVPVGGAAAARRGGQAPGAPARRHAAQGRGPVVARRGHVVARGRARARRARGRARHRARLAEGAVFDAWTEQFSLERWTGAFAAEGIDAAAIASAPRDPGRALPWDHLSAGLDRAYLLDERGRALRRRDDARLQLRRVHGVRRVPDARRRRRAGG